SVAASQPPNPSANPPKRTEVVEAIVKMSEAGISTEVIKIYVETYPSYYSLKAEDLIELKKHSIPDEVTVGLLKRSAELRTLKAKRTLVAQGLQGQAPFRSDSYDYFEYYYLYPRTLAAVNERLGMYPGYYPSYWSNPMGVRRGF